MSTTKIEWTATANPDGSITPGSTWNPVTGCTKISPGCQHCYAETFAERWRGTSGHPYEQGFDLKLWPERLKLPLHWKKPRRIFVNSMSDLFHESIPLEFIKAVFATMVTASWHTFQVLTKRADRLADLAPHLTWPANIWMGVSVENEDYLWRIDRLRIVPAALRFISLEPLLGPISRLNLENIDWVIVGGESGPGARPMDLAWVRAIRDQCQAAGVPFFFKQMLIGKRKISLPLLDGRQWAEFPCDWCGWKAPLAEHDCPGKYRDVLENRDGWRCNENDPEVK